MATKEDATLIETKESFVAENPVHLDDILEKLGAFGRHQVVTMCLLSLVYATNSMYNINYVFAVEDVQYRCKIPSCEANASFSVSWLNSSYPDLGEDVKQCQRYSLLDDQCAGFNTSRQETCTDWVYEVPHSFVAEFNLACQDWKPTLVGTAHSFGNMLGLLLQGQISDRFGRKTAAVFAGTMGAVLGLAKSFSTSFWCYVALEGLEAAIGDALSPMFMLSIEIVEKKKAVLFQMILLNCYTSGLIIMPFIAWAVPYWRNFLRVIYAPTLIILTYSFFLDESIRWLFSKGKRKEAIRLIERAAKRNDVKIDKVVLETLKNIDEETKNDLQHKSLLLKTFRSRIMVQRFLVCILYWFTITLINYGMMVSSVFIGGNKYLNFSLLMVMDIFSNIFYWLALSKYKRKTTLIFSFIVGGIFCVCQPFVPKSYAWVGLVLYMAFEMLATFSSNIVYIYTSELFPTYTRNSVHALCSAIGRIGSLIGPQTPLMISYWHHLPALLFGVTSLLCGGLTLLMPETAHTELPNTVREAEHIGRPAHERRPTMPEMHSLTQDKIV
ncbi:solute carrier family 22 member 2 [Amyelois transitella]|uniref:solute carrier family 22 member 2 n=1 Tax=Amyelois transitella TaxID=680683 RepID=UPI0029903946|nr:solute carrier family 22 member 2 [Amyelois transitella]XP_013196009.2 solute carrier family 22 member 2 [Amyelois transitella]XP_013196010.2 solute carrier family 22 member 2 [Amyelois transitella]XP_060805561.1 solute carrier family 22 member 2 [Amyelois transitella]